MAKLKTDFENKLKKLEEEKLALINKRKEDIAKLVVNILDKSNSLHIDDELLAGSILYVKDIMESDHIDKSNNSHEIAKLIGEFRAKAQKFFRKRPTTNSVSKQKIAEPT